LFRAKNEWEELALALALALVSVACTGKEADLTASDLRFWIIIVIQHMLFGSGTVGSASAPVLE
jgi:hypothetical protein